MTLSNRTLIIHRKFQNFLLGEKFKMSTWLDGCQTPATQMNIREGGRIQVFAHLLQFRYLQFYFIKQSADIIFSQIFSTFVFFCFFFCFNYFSFIIWIPFNSIQLLNFLLWLSLSRLICLTELVIRSNKWTLRGKLVWSAFHDALVFRIKSENSSNVSPSLDVNEFWIRDRIIIIIIL